MAKLADPGGRPVAGVMPYLAIGVVTDNRDPQGFGRVRVRFPNLHDELQSWWVRQVTPNGGTGHGLYALPEIGDEVLVAFLHGSQDHGVVLGALWNGKQTVPLEAKGELPGPDGVDTGGEVSTDAFADGSKDIEKNDRRFWRSRSGALLLFDDTDGARTVQLWDAERTLSIVFDSEEKRLIVSNTGADLHLRTKQDLYLEAGRDLKFQAGRNIEGASGQDTIHEAGTKVELTSGTDTSITTGASATWDVGANLDVSAGANVTIKGVMVTAQASANAVVKGSAMVEIKGGLVTLN